MDISELFSETLRNLRAQINSQSDQLKLAKAQIELAQAESNQLQRKLERATDEFMKISRSSNDEQDGQ